MRRGKEFAAILEAAFKPGVVRGGCGAPPCPEELSLGEANVIEEYYQRQGFNGRNRAPPARAAAGTRGWQTKALVDLWSVSNDSSKTTQEAKGIPFAGQWRPSKGEGRGRHARRVRAWWVRPRESAVREMASVIGKARARVPSVMCP